MTRDTSVITAIYPKEFFPTYLRVTLLMWKYMATSSHASLSGGLKKLNQIFITPLLISFQGKLRYPFLLQNDYVYVIFMVPEKCVYYVISRPNFILNGFLCSSPYIGFPVIQS